MTAGRDWLSVKLRPDGSVATQYPVTEFDAPAGWIAARAIWSYTRVDVGPFAFEPGDVLDEYFALDRPYNAFAIFREGSFVGWYCNVTHPTRLTVNEIVWHDLWLDVLVTPDGTVLVLDEDELEESGVAERDPDLHRMIVDARDELLELIARRAYPFSETPGETTLKLEAAS